MICYYICNHEAENHENQNKKTTKDENNDSFYKIYIMLVYHIVRSAIQTTIIYRNPLYYIIAFKTSSCMEYLITCCFYSIVLIVKRNT